MPKKILIITTIICLTFMARVTIAQDAEMQQQLEKLKKVYSSMNVYYVDSVNNTKIVEVAIKAMLKELDPHSAYLDPKETQESLEPLNGNFEGIGIQYQIIEDTLIVISPISGGPSDKVGIMSGDKIVEIDGQNATGKIMTISWAQKQLKGAKGSKVNVIVKRDNNNELLNFVITRDIIPIYSIDAKYMVDNNIGYIKLNKFSKSSNEELEKAIDTLKRNGMKKLILDLRNNPGGLLDVAISITDEFLPYGKLIVYTEGKVVKRTEAIATSKGSFEKGDLVILINEGSASASEIVAGAIQDWDRGIIVGRRSFGKGLVQRPFDMPDKSQVRITIARYYTPSGRCIQKPYNTGNDDYFMEIEKRYKHGELINSDSISFPDSLKYYTSNGKVVYGGGGIMPDVFVPFDSTIYNTTVTKFISKGIANNYAVHYTNDNKKRLLKEYPNGKVFANKYNISEEEERKIIEKCIENGIIVDSEEYQKSKEIIDTYIKAFIARNLYNDDSFYEVINKIAPEFNMAVKILRKN